MPGTYSAPKTTGKRCIKVVLILLSRPTKSIDLTSCNYSIFLSPVYFCFLKTKGTQSGLTIFFLIHCSVLTFMLCYGFVNVNIQAYYTWGVPLSSCQVVYTFFILPFLFAFKAKYCTRPTYCLINSIVNTVCVLTVPLPFSLHVYYQFYFLFYSNCRDLLLIF